MSNRQEMRFAGEGGQGVVTMALILAEAASIYEGKNVAMTQSYAAQQRGGPARAEVIISDGRIDYPKVIEADLLVALNQDAYDRYHHQVKRNGVIILESAAAGGESGDNVTVVKVPLEEIACRSTGSRVSANFVALGVISGLDGTVGLDALKSATEARAPRAHMAQNIKALDAGATMGRYIKEGKVVSPVELGQS